MSKKNKNLQLKKTCIYCKQKQDWRWIEISPGHTRQVRFCCERKEKKENIAGFSLHKFSREPVAFGYDKKTGQPLAIDKKGRRFDPSETRYAQHSNDRFGWKATGKIKPKKKYNI